MSLDIEVDISELEQFADQLADAERPISRIMRRTMQTSVDLAEQAIVVETPVNTGNARGSISTEVRGSPVGFQGEILMGATYGLPLEHGRKPGRMPPPDVIELWVIRKGLAPPGPESRWAAFLIARAIGRRGTKGAHMFEKGMNNVSRNILRLWENATGRILAEFAD